MHEPESRSKVEPVHWRTIRLGSFSDLRSFLTDESDRLCWIDGAGIHIDETRSFPDERPFGLTHVWGWCGTRLFRARVDGKMVFAAEVEESGAALPSDGWEQVLSRLNPTVQLVKPVGAHAMMRLFLNGRTLDSPSLDDIRVHVRTILTVDRSPVSFLRFIPV